MKWFIRWIVAQCLVIVAMVALAVKALVDPSKATSTMVQHWLNWLWVASIALTWMMFGYVILVHSKSRWPQASVRQRAVNVLTLRR